MQVRVVSYAPAVGTAKFSRSLVGEPVAVDLGAGEQRQQVVARCARMAAISSGKDRTVTSRDEGMSFDLRIGISVTRPTTP